MCAGINLGASHPRHPMKLEGWDRLRNLQHKLGKNSFGCSVSCNVGEGHGLLGMGWGRNIGDMYGGWREGENKEAGQSGWQQQRRLDTHEVSCTKKK